MPKISALPPDSAVDAGDLFPIVDIATSVTKKVAYGQFPYNPTFTGGVSRPLTTRFSDAISALDFALGDGITNDLAALQAAVNTGKSVYFPEASGGFYFMGNYSTPNTEVPVLQIIGRAHTRYWGPGLLQVTSSSSCVPMIVQIDNSHDIEVDLGFNDPGFNPAITYQGAMGVNIAGSLGDCYNIYTKIRGTNLVACLNTGNQNASVPAGKIYGLIFDVEINNGFYGAIFRNGGNQVKGIVRSKQIDRSYFVYGVRDHDIIVFSDTHPAGYAQDCLIKTYDGANTENIKVRYACTNFVSQTAPVFISNETTTGKIVRDIDVEVNDVDASNTNPFSVFIEGTTGAMSDVRTTKVVTNVKVSGHCRYPPYINTLFETSVYANQLVIEVTGEIARKMTSLRPVFNFAGGGTAMPGLGSTNQHRWQIGGHLHQIYAGVINNALIQIPLATNENALVPVEMFIADSESNSSGYLHKAMTFFVQNNAGVINIFGSSADFNSPNGVNGLVIPSAGTPDANNSATIKFTFSGWQAAPNGNAGYLRFVYPDLNKSEVIT